MTDWTAGYVADIGYTYGYYGELNPARIQHAFLSAGLIPPQVATACELGFGQGLSTAIHAAAAPVAWYGTDFNPAQAGFAQALAQVSDSSAQLFDESFGQFCARTDLPDFDFIGLHGIWSWISDENRHIIVDFVRRKLKVGGVLYISYNTEPGWAAMVPMRRLLTTHSAVMSPPGVSTVDKVNSALEFADRLLATHPLYAKVNPQVAERIRAIKTQNRHYVAHEYFNQDWLPMAFSDMAEWLAPAKLNFACSSHLLEHIDSINLTAPQREFLATLPDRMLRESVRDFICNQTFRRDYWVRGARRMGTVEAMEAVRKLRVLLLTPRSSVELKTKGALGLANMSEAVYTPILNLLADYKPRTVGQLEQQLADQGLTHGQVLEAFQILAGNGNLATVQDEKAIARARALRQAQRAFDQQGQEQRRRQLPGQPGHRRRRAGGPFRPAVPAGPHAGAQDRKRAGRAVHGGAEDGGQPPAQGRQAARGRRQHARRTGPSGLRICRAAPAAVQGPGHRCLSPPFSAAELLRRRNGRTARELVPSRPPKCYIYDA
ncbi:MAG: class I SAM-dependent methyltransferase [Gammaproteobacteria bacterium]